MRRGRPKSAVETGVLAVRIPVALRAALDRYLEALATRLGLKASRNEILRQAVRHFLAAQAQRGLDPLPRPLQEASPTS